ncbi:MAG: hypothetical protein PHU43_00635 [Candidatus Bipolaricaulis sp.]|nr:hypothetical protein [Candidatus Bipolaricaulis sp.]
MTSASDARTSAGPPTATLYLVPPRSNRRALGRRLAAPMLSERPRDRALAERGVHPDVIELAAEDGKEKIGIDQVREAIRAAQFSPVESDRKVCLVPRAESLTVEAANGLLKTLEEPPRGMVFALLAEHAGDLLPTIVSRSRIVRVPPEEREARTERLTTSGYSDADAQWLSRIADRPGDLDGFLETRLEVPAARAAAAARTAAATIEDVISFAIGDDPVLRRESLTEIVARAVALDPALFTTGVAQLAAQERTTLFLFLQELLGAAFDLLRQAIAAADRGAPAAALGTDVLERTCLAVDRAHRALYAFAPTEGVLLSLLFAIGGVVHAE